MAHLFRLIVAVLVAAFSLASHALVPKQPTGWTFSDAYGSGNLASADLACAHAASVSSGVSGFGPQGGAWPDWSTSSGWNCVVTFTAGGTVNRLISRNGAGNMVCPANSTSVTGGCQCTAPYVENAAHTACELPPDPCKALKGQSAGDWWRDTGDDNGLPAKIGFSVCNKYEAIGNGLCVATVPSTGGLCVQTEGGWWRCTGEAFYTGTQAVNPTKCSPSGPGGSGDSATDPMPSTPPSGNPPVAPSQPDPNTAAPAPCPAGQAPGSINGTSVCRPTGGDRPSTAAAPGTGSTTTNNSDGSSTTSTTSGTTQCSGGSCNTTTNNTNVTTNAPGNSTCPAGQTVGSTTVAGQTRTTCTGTTSGTTTQAQAGFCEKNPKNPQCGGEGGDTSFGGTCAAGFKAQSDDAVINAMAEETFRQNCKVNPADSETTLAAAERVKTGNQTTDNPNNASLSISPSSIDTSDAIGGGGGCIADKAINVAGGTVVLPLSRFCDSFPMLGNLLVAIGFLVAAVIIMRG